MRCPFAQWRGPVPNLTPGGMAGGAHGVVFHIMGASMAAADGWFHNPSARASAHFGIGLDGTLVQWVDTGDRAWHAAAANAHWFGVETEGSSGPLSDAGVATFGRLYRWLVDACGAVTTIVNDPAGPVGFGWHGMGGAAWGGHDYCPGLPRENQRQAVLDAMGGHPVPTPQEEETMTTFTYAGQLHAVMVDAQGALRHRWADAAGWHTEVRSSGNLAGATVAVDTSFAGQLHLLTPRPDGSMQHDWFDGAGWGAEVVA